MRQATDSLPRGGAPGFAKALMRSGLWQQSSHVKRSLLPTMGQMINSQTGIEAPAETQEEMLARYAADL